MERDPGSWISRNMARINLFSVGSIYHHKILIHQCMDLELRQLTHPENKYLGEVFFSE